MKFRFAIVRDWKNEVSAEQECLERIKNAAADLNIKCDVVDTEYRLFSDPRIKASKLTHDFVLHVHFFSGKAENLFSIVPLWNPIDIYHQWGYEKSTSTLLTNDDFLHTGSARINEHHELLTHDDGFHVPPKLLFYPSVSKIAFQPILRRDRKLFYCGINWEKLANKRGRNSELLHYLDENGGIEIYGPQKLQGIKPWEGYKCYRGEIPFDGKSLLERISECGIVLVLSASSHINDQIATNRLFEAIAAGAVVIADQNPGVKNLVGDAYIKVDTRESDCGEKVLGIVKWLNEHPKEAYELAEKAQNVFTKQLSGQICLKNLYDNLEIRKAEIQSERKPNDSFKLVVIYINIDGRKETTDIIERSINANLSPMIKNYVICDTAAEEMERATNIEFQIRGKDRVDYGEMVSLILNKIEDDYDYFSVVFPGEELYDNHFESVVSRMQKKQAEIGYANLIVGTNTIDGLRFLGVDAIDYLHRYSCSGAFVFKKNILNGKKNLLMKFINKDIAVAMLCGDVQVAATGGYTCKMHRHLERQYTDNDLIRKIMDMDKFKLTDKGWPVSEVVKEISVSQSHLKKIYYKNYKYIAWIRRYPMIWGSIRRIGKFLMS